MSKGVQTVSNLQTDETHEYRINHNKWQTKTVALFACKFLPIMGTTTPWMASRPSCTGAALTPCLALLP